MKKILKSLIPLGIAAGVVFGNTFFSHYFIIPKHIYTLQIGNIDTGIKTLGLLYIVTFCISYFLTGLAIKDKRNIIWFVALYIVVSLIPFCLGVVKINYIIYNLPNYIKESLSAVLLYLGFNWIEKNKQTKELEKQNLQSELALLKNQLNPHFLFNTLNNIDRLIKSNPDHASQSLIELSDMMRYMLYESNVNRVPLQKELDYINDYLKLQEIQYANVNLVDYSISGNTDRIEKITVAPMLFIPFIENAFKHCTDKEKEHAIQFSMIIETEHIRFRSINIVDLNHSINKDASSGIGLETVKRRLKILYPNKHSLQIYERNNLFCVELSIEAND